jgi:hypothetical protein
MGDYQREVLAVFVGVFFFLSMLVTAFTWGRLRRSGYDWAPIRRTLLFQLLNRTGLYLGLVLFLLFPSRLLGQFGAGMVIASIIALLARLLVRLIWSARHRTIQGKEG